MQEKGKGRGLGSNQHPSLSSELLLTGTLYLQATLRKALEAAAASNHRVLAMKDVTVYQSFPDRRIVPTTLSYHDIQNCFQ